MKFLSPMIRFELKETAFVLPPSPPISNFDIFKHFPRTAGHSESFQKKMAAMIAQEFDFHQRYWSHCPWETLDEASETSETLAANALAKLFSAYPEKTVDAFVLGSTTNTRYSGSQATSVLGKFEITCPAYDFKAGCSTSLAAFSLAYGLMALGYKKVLVCCAETMSKIIDPNNEKTWLGVADGAAALLFEHSDSGRFCIEKNLFSTDGRYVDAYTTRGQLPPTATTLEKDGYFLRGDEQLLKQLAEEQYDAMLELLFKEIDKNEIQWIIPHQVNRRLINELIARHDLHHAQLLWDADKIGNIGGASISYTLSRAIHEGLFNKTGKILMMSVGGGLSFATQLLSYTLEEPL